MGQEHVTHDSPRDVTEEEPSADQQAVVVGTAASSKSAPGVKKDRKKSRAKRKDDVYVTARRAIDDQQASTLLVEVEGKSVLMHFCCYQGCRFSSRKRTDVDRHLRTHTGTYFLRKPTILSSADSA